LHGEKEIAKKFVPLLNEANVQVMLSAHLHRHVRAEASEGTHHFPVLVNSNTSIIKAQVDEKQLLIEMFDLEGKKIDTISIKPNN